MSQDQQEGDQTQNGSGTAVASPSQWLQEELRARGLDDALERLYQSIGDMSPGEKQGVFAISLEAEGQAFELRCAICASFASDRQLHEWIDQYNAWAREKRLKTVAYEYAKELSRVGGRFVDADRRITRDFPCLTPSFFVVALRAKPEKYFDVLETAQERIEKHERDPEHAPRLTLDGFRSMIHEAQPPTVDIKSKVQKPEPPAPGKGNGSNVTANAGRQPDELDVECKTGRVEVWGETGLVIPAGTLVYLSAAPEGEDPDDENGAFVVEDVRILSDEEPHGVEIEGDRASVDAAVAISRGGEQAFRAMRFGDGRVAVGVLAIESLIPHQAETPTPAPQPEPCAPEPVSEPAATAVDEINCYECKRCRRVGPGDDSTNRLAVVKTDGRVLFVDEESPAWACGLKRRVISVRTQVFPRAVAIAKACSEFEKHEADKKAAEPEPSVTSDGADDGAGSAGASEPEPTGEPTTVDDLIGAPGGGA